MQQQVENGDEDGESNASWKRGVDASVGAGSSSDCENAVSRAGNGANKKRQMKGSEGDQDGK